MASPEVSLESVAPGSPLLSSLRSMFSILLSSLCTNSSSRLYASLCGLQDLDLLVLGLVGEGSRGAGFGGDCSLHLPLVPALSCEVTEASLSSSSVLAASRMEDARTAIVPP